MARQTSPRDPICKMQRLNPETHSLTVQQKTKLYIPHGYHCVRCTIWAKTRGKLRKIKTVVLRWWDFRKILFKNL
jgi:hypothetical protein